MRKLSSLDQLNWRFSVRVLLPVVFGIVGVLALAGMALTWAVRESNAISVERQMRTTERSIRATVGELAKQQEMVAVWNDTVSKLRQPTLDETWLDANIGAWLNKVFGQDQVYILNPANEPVYGAIDGVHMPAGAFEQVRPNLESLVRGLRGGPGSSRGDHAGQPAGPAYLTSGRAVHDAHLFELFGRPAAVSVMKIVPENDDLVLAPGEEHLLVSVRFLDGTFIRQLANQNLIDGLRFSRISDPLPGEVAVPFQSDEGSLIGYFIWLPELPGTTVLSVVGPGMALGCILFFVMTGLLVRSLRRSMANLRRAVHELRASEAQAHHLAFHDGLTGLPNRALFEERLDEALVQARRRGEAMAVLMLDLDRFKKVNDTLGHQAGDEVVREFARRLSDLLRSTDFIARLGGDEFAVVLPGIHGGEVAEAACNRILDAVRRPFDVLGHQAFVGVSIGVVLMPDAGFDRTDLMRKADIALYRAKAEGRGSYRIFTEAMDDTVKVRGAIEDELRAALMDGGSEFRLFYQPQVNMNGQFISGLEALVRWQHPTRGLIGPGEFISIAEETGLILPLGEWVLRQACLASLRWPDLSIAINLSPLQFRSSAFADRFIAIVRETGADPNSLELEITEGLLLDDDDLSRTALKTLREAGFRIALDDFGTGYSSLSYLRRFEVDKIKIDRSFIQDVGQKEGAAAIVTAIVALCRAMGLTVIAEGVETEDQQRFLWATGCSEMQGYLFSRALPEEQIGGVLDRLGETFHLASLTGAQQYRQPSTRTAALR